MFMGFDPYVKKYKANSQIILKFFHITVNGTKCKSPRHLVNITGTLLGQAGDINFCGSHKRLISGAGISWL